MPKEHGASYRRGVLLGLTMAEIFVLIIFLLLLAFANMLSKKDLKLVEMEKKVQLVEKNDEAISRIVSAIAKKPDMTKELVELSESFPSFIQKINDYKLLEDGQSIDEYIGKLIDRDQEQKSLKAEDKIRTPTEELDLALARQKELEADVKNLQGQNENLTSQMKGEGRSVDPPPCWPDNFKKGGWKDSIFKIDLTSDGIVVNDNSPSERQLEKSKLPLDKVRLGVTRSTGEFYTETRPLFNWSKEHECRFLVLVYDRTGTQEKAKYKELLKVVEGHFYKKEIGVISNVSKADTTSQKMLEEKQIPENNSSNYDKYGRYKPNTIKKIFGN